MRAMRVFAFILACALAAVGQTNRGGISGTVSDQNGAAIPGATVTVTNAGTNQKVVLTTSESGSFQAASLEPVVYTVLVEAAGFKRTLLENVKVDTSTIVTADVLMQIGSADAEVTVVSDPPLLNTESGTTTQTITERQLQDVPLSNRSVLDLAVTAPNVSGDAGSEDPEVTSGQPVPGFNLSLNGGRPGSTAILADGVNNTGVGIARAVVSFTPETVQEFTVQTSAYSAEFGQSGGGVINLTTKSGTNRFNGTALWYHRNPATAASPFVIGTAPRVPNRLRSNQVSISAGGPIFVPKLYDGRDKTFFFFAYEPRFRRDFVTANTIVPTAAERAGDFRNLVRTNSGYLPADVAARFNLTSVGDNNIYQQFTVVNGRLQPIILATGSRYCQFGEAPTIQATTNPQCLATTTPVQNANSNIIPQAFRDPTAQRLLEFLPTGGDYFIDDAGLVRNLQIQRFVQQDETRYTARIDHNFSQSDQVYFRYTVTPAVGVRGFGSDVNGNSAAYSDAKQFLVSHNHIFAPTLVNNLRLNYTRGVFSEDFSPEFSINGGRNLATELGLPSLTNGGIPLFQISSDSNGYNAFSNIGSSGSTNNFNVEERFNINDIVNWTRGNQTWKMGVDLSYARLNVVPFFAASGGRWDFRVVNTSSNRSTNVANGGNPFASLLIGVPNNVDVRPILLNYDYRWKAGALFFQDDWRVRPNLTVNLGVRYSLQYPRTEKNDLQGVFRPDLAQTVTLTQAQRRATAIGLGLLATTVPADVAIPSVVPTTVSLPPFAFAGQGGRSRYITPVDYTGIEPRFGFAWSPKFFGFASERNAVIRGGFGISHAPITGNNRTPNPDFGSFTGVSTLANGSTVGGTANSTLPVRLSDNPPQLSNTVGFMQRLGVDANGLVYNSLGVPGVAVAQDSGRIPYSTNWNLSVSFEPFHNTVVEVAYVGNRGTHLYLPQVNLNPSNTAFVEFLEGSNLPAENTFADPLGRTNLLGAVIAIQRNSVATQYFGFNNLNRFFDPSANSIRHAGYIDVRRRVGRGLTFTANYTYGKSIDDASDASPDTRVLTVGNTQGQVSYGAPRELDRSVSTFDIKHNFASTFVYDLPFGKGRTFFSGAPGIVDAVVGGWTVSGVVRLQGGLPYLPFVTDTNRLGGTNRTVRPDIIPGVPIINPRWTRDCPIGTTCEPYINPAAFLRPAKGSLGNAPRVLDVRSPLQEYFDASFQKNFKFPFADNEGKRRIQLRVDLINAFNHPNFRYNNLSGTAGFTGGLPNEALLTQTDVNAWLAANPGRTASLTQINALLTSSRLPAGGLPLDFFRVPAPEGFATRDATSFDITTLEGLKLYRLRQSYNTAFGNLFAVNNPRYVQFGLKIYF